MTTTASTTSYLEIVIGPMYSGKTSYLVEQYKKYKYIGKNVICLNYDEDMRYSSEELSTHDLIKIPCIFVNRLSDIWLNPKHPNYTDIQNCNIILINEGQFFDDLKPVVLDMIEPYGGRGPLSDRPVKSVYISGLDGDYCRGTFGQILDLIPFCDQVTKKTALCAFCRDGTPAPFTHRIVKSHEQKLIGTDMYMPLCRNCYLASIK